MIDCLYYIDNDDAIFPLDIPQDFIDLHYLKIISKNNFKFIRGVNPHIRKLFYEIHVSLSAFEEFFNQNPNIVHRPGYGTLFENYFLCAFWKSANKKIIFEERENLEVFSFEFQQVFLKSYQTEGKNNMIYLERSFDSYDVILMTPK